jgi:hypothetical protein
LVYEAPPLQRVHHAAPRAHDLEGSYNVYGGRDARARDPFRGRRAHTGRDVLLLQALGVDGAGGPRPGHLHKVRCTYRCACNVLMLNVTSGDVQGRETQPDRHRSLQGLFRPSTLEPLPEAESWPSCRPLQRGRARPARPSRSATRSFGRRYPPPSGRGAPPPAPTAPGGVTLLLLFLRGEKNELGAAGIPQVLPPPSPWENSYSCSSRPECGECS